MSEMSQHPDLSEAIEPEGIDAVSILKMVAGSFILVLVILFTTMELSSLSFEKAKRDMTQHSGYPLLQETRSLGQGKLNGYAKINSETGMYRIPIDRAMELVVRDANRSRN